MIMGLALVFVQSSTGYSQRDSSLKLFTLFLYRATPQASRQEPAGDSQPTLHTQSYLVTVKESVGWTLHERRSNPTFKSLTELVHSKRSLEILYPNISKAVAFPNN